jgi:hypothetical protein
MIWIKCLYNNCRKTYNEELSRAKLDLYLDQLLGDREPCKHLASS